MPVQSPNKTGGKTNRPTSPRIDPPAQVPQAFEVPLKLFSSVFITDSSLVAKPIPVNVPRSILPGFIRVHLRSVSLSPCDIRRANYHCNLNARETFPMSFGYIATGTFVNAGTNSDQWNLVAPGAPVLVFRPNASSFGPVTDIPYNWIYQVPEYSNRYLMVGPWITAKLMLDSIGAPTTGSASVLIVHGESATGMLTAMKCHLSGFNITVVVYSVSALQLYRQIWPQILAVLYYPSLFSDWTNEQRRFDYLMLSVDWTEFSVLYDCMKMMKPFKGFMIVHGPAHHLKKQYSLMLNLFANFSVKFQFVSLQADVLQERLPSLVREAVVSLNETRDTTDRILSGTPYVGLGALTSYVTDSVHAPHCGQAFMDLAPQ